jgi:AraC-like DNA-binding protein
MLAERLSDQSEDARDAPPIERELRARLLGGSRPRGPRVSPGAVEVILLLRRLLAPPQEGIAETLAWAGANLAASPSLDDLVAHSGFSKSVFLDRFRKATGTSPMKWLSERNVAEVK